MDEFAFDHAYCQSRNGTNQYYRHMVRYFIYTDGVKECADAGCHWILDIIATEVAPLMRKNEDHYLGLFQITVPPVPDGSVRQALLSFTVRDDDPPVWMRQIEHTDMVEGEYVFKVCYDGEHVVCCLMTED